MAKKRHNKDKKLHNFDEKLHNSDVVNNEPDLSWQERVDLMPEDEFESGSEIYYFIDDDDNIHSREFLAEELIPDDVEDREDPLKSRHEKVQRLKPSSVEIINLVPASGKTHGEISLPVPKSGRVLSIFGYPAKSFQICTPKKSHKATAPKKTGTLSFILKIAQLPARLRAL